MVWPIIPKNDRNGRKEEKVRNVTECDGMLSLIGIMWGSRPEHS